MIIVEKYTRELTQEFNDKKGKNMEAFEIIEEYSQRIEIQNQENSDEEKELVNCRNTFYCKAFTLMNNLSIAKADPIKPQKLYPIQNQSQSEKNGVMEIEQEELGLQKEACKIGDIERQLQTLLLKLEDKLQNETQFEKNELQNKTAEIEKQLLHELQDARKTETERLNSAQKSLEAALLRIGDEERHKTELVEITAQLKLAEAKATAIERDLEEQVKRFQTEKLIIEERHKTELVRITAQLNVAESKATRIEEQFQRLQTEFMKSKSIEEQLQAVQTEFKENQDKSKDTEKMIIETLQTGIAEIRDEKSEKLKLEEKLSKIKTQKKQLQTKLNRKIQEKNIFKRIAGVIKKQKLTVLREKRKLEKSILINNFFPPPKPK